MPDTLVGVEMFGHSVDAELELVFLQRSLAEPLYALTCQHRAYLSRWLPWPLAIASVEDTLVFIQRMVQCKEPNNLINELNMWELAERAGS